MSSVGKVLQLGSRLVRIAALNPTRLRTVLGTALSATNEVMDRSCDLFRLRRVTVNELLPSNGPPLRVNLALFPMTQASVSLLESVCLILLLGKAKATKVFEFGTYKGVSTAQLALNLAQDGRVFTLDLPTGGSQTQFVISDPREAQIAAEPGKGSLVPDDLKPRIVFLQHDSATFDESQYSGQMDFVFVDGAHSYEYVRNDSEKGWRMLRSGGIIAWHDCGPQDAEVVRYLIDSPYTPGVINGTTLAFAVKP
jgi:hypothetical protein